MSRVRVAVIGHVEWVTHTRGDMPRAGEIVRLTDPLEEPAGGGAVAAAQVAALGAECHLFTAVGDDPLGRAAVGRLRTEGIEVHWAWRDTAQTRAWSTTGASGDRAIALVGDALGADVDDPLPWDLLPDCDAVYFTGHHAGALRAARTARVLVVSARRAALLAGSGVRADVVVGSAGDPDEAVTFADLPIAPDAILVTEGADGGRVLTPDGRTRRWHAAAPPGPAVDSYGCGDSFAAGVTVGLARGAGLMEAVALGARCGAHCITGRGALGAQLREP